ncbi:MAG: hypothetical protein ACFFCW_35840, partial [Candidatus Hodarchaeota archaeon]
AVNEVIRVTKKGGTISIFLVNKWASTINNFYKKPAFTLASIEVLPSYLKDEHGKYRIVSTEEARKLFENEGIRVLEICADCGWINVHRIPEKVRKSRVWDEQLFGQTTEMVLN